MHIIIAFLGFCIVLFLFPQFVLFVAAILVAVFLIFLGNGTVRGVDSTFWSATFPVFLLIIGVAWALTTRSRTTTPKSHFPTQSAARAYPYDDLDDLDGPIIHDDYNHYTPDDPYFKDAQDANERRVRIARALGRPY